MKAIFKKFNWMELLFGILLVAVGVATIVLAIVNKGAVSRTLSIIVSIFFFIFGVLAIVMSLVSDTKLFTTSALVYGSFLIALGVVVLINPEFVPTLLVTLIAVFLIAYGTVSLVKGILCIVYKMKWYWAVGSFLIAAVGITSGILAFCYKDIAFTATFVVAGIGIIVFGVLEIVNYFINGKKKKEEAAK